MRMVLLNDIGRGTNRFSWVYCFMKTSGFKGTKFETTVLGQNYHSPKDRAGCHEPNKGLGLGMATKVAHKMVFKPWAESMKPNSSSCWLFRLNEGHRSSPVKCWPAGWVREAQLKLGFYVLGPRQPKPSSQSCW
uniref:T1.6 protein n=1 Tax=Malus x robusta TaxID=1184610 RepID=I7KCV4_9ROSA|nr:T1.6 [Malus x robusta]